MRWHCIQSGIVYDLFYECFMNSPCTTTSVVTYPAVASNKLIDHIGPKEEENVFQEFLLKFIWV